MLCVAGKRRRTNHIAQPGQEKHALSYVSLINVWPNVYLISDVFAIVAVASVDVIFSIVLLFLFHILS